MTSAPALLPASRPAGHGVGIDTNLLGVPQDPVVAGRSGRATVWSRNLPMRILPDDGVCHTLEWRMMKLT